MNFSIPISTSLKHKSVFDMTLAIIVGALLAASVVMVFSASLGIQSSLGSEGYSTIETFRPIVRHLLSICAGLLSLSLAFYINIGVWRRLGRVLFPIGIVLLAVLLIPGISREVNGSTRWIFIGSVGVQPSEMVKVLVILYLADYFTRNSGDIRSFVVSIVRPAVILGVISILLLAEPDLGSAVVILFIALGMMFLAGVRLYHLGSALGAVFVLLAVLIYTSPYRFARFTGFLDPWADPTGNGYQLVQALIAFGSGEWLGVGLGFSVQKLYYLPHANNDFLAAVIAEELGFVGVAILIGLYAVLLWRTFQIARRAFASGDLFATRVAQGIGLLIALQMMIHLGVNLGVVPTTGLTMPLMSFGGSSMVASCFAVGLLFSIDRGSRQPRLARR